MRTTRNTFLACLCITLVAYSIIHFRMSSAPSRTGPKAHCVNIKEKQFFDLRVIVIVYDRDQSLLRLLKSINNAEYGCDKVKLEVWIDRSVNGTVSQRTLRTAEYFNFAHGNYSVHIHSKHVGTFGQWVIPWKPNSDSSEIMVLLEDDLTVSPYFYKYLKLVHKKYDDIAEINSYTLQGVSHAHYVYDNRRLTAPKEHAVFLYPVIGTWGFSPNRRNWKRFINWLSNAVRNRSFQPYVPENIATRWYKSFQAKGRPDSMWEIWHIYYAWTHNEFSLYPNFEGLCVNWREKGNHYSGTEGGATNALLTEWKVEYEHLPRSPVHLDLRGRILEKH